MGESNSSVTRAWPIFGTLFERDSTGQSWLNPLLELCSDPVVSGATGRAEGNLHSALAAFDRPMMKAG